MQMVPLLSRGRMIPDLLAILGSLDLRARGCGSMTVVTRSDRERNAMLSDEERREIEAELTRYPTRQAASASTR